MTDAQTTLAIIGTGREPIKITLGEYKGVRTLDIRRHYFDKASKELKPTPKGIAVTDAHCSELRKVLELNGQKIDEWLAGGSSDSVATAVHAEQMLAIQARLESQFAAVPARLLHKSTQSPGFFASESKGGLNEISLNDNHPIMSAMQRVQVGDLGLEQFVLMLLSSFHRAKCIFFGSEVKLSAQDIFEILEFNWGLYLKQALKGMGP